MTTTTPTTMEPEQLAGLLAEVLGEPAHVAGLTRLTGGASREIWAFELRVGQAPPRRVILRRDPPGEPRPPDAVALEAQVMRAAHGAGVTVPDVLAVLDDSASLRGGGLVMDRVEGESVPRRVLTTPALAAARAALAGRCGRELGLLHGIDPSAVPGLPSEHRIDSYRAHLDRLGAERPVLELAYAWLIRHRPPPRGEVLVHGDFRLGNLVVDEKGLVAVLDWESVHRGDRLEDLGWIAVPSWRFRGPGTVGGFGNSADLLRAYEAHTGVAVSTAEFTWAVVLGTWVWAVGSLVQAERHHSGAVRSVDLAMVGRRVVEVERDLLELIG